MSDIPAVILCGGQGLRLRSVVADRPKCLASIDGRPFLGYLFALLKSHGFKRIVCCLGHRSSQVEEYLRSCSLSGIEITCSVEVEPLGTAGALKNAQALVPEPCFLALNGDTILEADYAGVIEAHLRTKAIATLALWRCASPSARYGRVELDPGNNITRFHEKPASGAAAQSPWISGGVYVFSHEIFDRIPAPPPAVSLETQVFPSLIGRGLHGFPCEGYFLDIGVPEDYARAQAELPGRFPSC